MKVSRIRKGAWSERFIRAPPKDPNRRSVANTVVAVEAMVLKVRKVGSDGRRQKRPLTVDDCIPA